MQNNSEIFVTVLKNISTGTPVENEALILIEKLQLNKAGIKSKIVWQSEAYKTFYELLESKIKLMQTLQKDCINSIMFQLENLEN
jgi:hypothetical protein